MRDYQGYKADNIREISTDKIIYDTETFENFLDKVTEEIWRLVFVIKNNPYAFIVIKYGSKGECVITEDFNTNDIRMVMIRYMQDNRTLENPHLFHKPDLKEYDAPLGMIRYQAKRLLKELGKQG